MNNLDRIIKNDFDRTVERVSMLYDLPEPKPEPKETPRFFYPRICTKKFREYLFNKYPSVFENWRMLRVFEFVLFSSFIDRDSKDQILSRDILARLTKSEEQLANNKFVAQVAIKEYQTYFPKFVVSDYTHDKPRMIRHNGLDDEDMRMLQENLAECLILSDEHKVRFIDNTPFTKRLKYKLRDDIVAFQKARYEELEMNEDQKLIIDYLHSHDVNIFSRLVNQNIEYASQVKDSLVYDPTKKNSKPTQERILDTIRQYPKPHYKASINNKSMRIHTCNECFIGLKREIRKAICKGCIEADLKSSQFAILAMQLKSKVALDFVKTGKSLWKGLNQFVKGTDIIDPLDKDVMKEALYSIAFGKSKNGTYDKQKNWHEGVKHILARRSLEKALEHPIMIDLFERRDKWFKAIKERQGWNDAYGNFQAITETRDVKSVAACVIQSIELRIIKAAFDIAIQEGERLQFAIITFQHDGFCMKVNDMRNLDTIKDLMQNAVKQAASTYNVLTYLEFETL